VFAGKTTIDSCVLKPFFFDQANVLHIICVESSTDAASCYDVVHHTTGSFALQAMLVPKNLVKCCLLCLQTIQFYLITRYGMAKKSYGGTHKNIFMGFAQGSGGASSAWLAVCTLVVCVCKHVGHGSTFQSAWTGLLLTVATILYVNNAYLLHMCCEQGFPELNFIKCSQYTTYYWVTLLQSTGGHLKDAKCYWCSLSFKFICICHEAKLTSPHELSGQIFTITQPDSSDIPIKQKDMDDASNVLEVFLHPTGEATAQLKHMIGKKLNGPQMCMKAHFPTGKPARAFIVDPCHPSDIRLVPLMAYTMTVDVTFANSITPVYLHWG
jgi:hypothetical protein